MSAYDINEKGYVYFLGIGGVSMSGLAMILKHNGYKVAGSDMSASKTTDELNEMGIRVNIGHNAKNITRDIDLVVYTAAVKEDNPELIEAKKLGLDIMDRGSLLGDIMLKYDKSIAVSGTHGKTTTSSMVSEIFLNAGKDPTISLGGILPSINGTVKIGGKKYFIAEACEYYDSFLNIEPYIAVILNVEKDHLDYFKTIDRIRQSFRDFANLVPHDGFIIINEKIENLSYITEGARGRIFTFGIGETADFSAKNLKLNDTGCYSFDVCYNGGVLDQITLAIPGIHNVENALAAFASAYVSEISVEEISATLRNFAGAKRRFQHKGKINGAEVVDDYAHHPTEISATLKAAKGLKFNRVWCLFQPHTYSRTKAFLTEFAEALSHADNIVLAPIYAAREKDTGEISSADIARIINKKFGKNAVSVANFKEAETFLRENLKDGDLLITMGAGDIYIVGEVLVS